MLVLCRSIARGVYACDISCFWKDVFLSDDGSATTPPPQQGVSANECDLWGQTVGYLFGLTSLRSFLLFFSSHRLFEVVFWCYLLFCYLRHSIQDTDKPCLILIIGPPSSCSSNKLVQSTFAALVASTPYVSPSIKYLRTGSTSQISRSETRTFTPPHTNTNMTPPHPSPAGRPRLSLRSDSFTHEDLSAAFAASASSPRAKDLKIRVAQKDETPAPPPSPTEAFSFEGKPQRA